MDINLARAVDTIEARYKEDSTRRERWKRYRRVYEGEVWGEDTPDHLSRVDCGKLFATVSQLAPLMTDSRPIWSVVARNPAVQPIVEEWNRALEFLWEELDMGSKLQAAYQDALLMEQGCLQIDYDETEEEVRVGVVNPMHLVFQRGRHSDLDECAWVCKRRKHTLGDLRRRYPAAAGDIVPDPDDDDGDLDRSSGSLDSFSATNAWATVYELWLRDDTVEDDLKGEDGDEAPKRRRLKYPNGRFVTFTRSGREGKPVLLADYPSPFGHGKPPFVLVYDYRLSHEIWGVGEGRHLMPLVDELNEVLQSVAGKVRNTCRNNYVIDSTVVDAEKVKSDFHRGGQFWVKKNQGGDDLRYTGIEPVPTSPPLQAEFQYIQFLETVLEDLTSVTDIIRGQSAKRERQTAQEFSGLYEAGHTRTRLRVRMLELSVKRVLHRILSVMMEFYRESRYFSNEDSDGGVTYGTISNRLDDARRIISRYVDEEFDAQEEEGEEEPSLHGETDRERARDAALDRLMRALPVGADRVSMRFQILVQSQSSLPTDLQSRANLALRLAQMGIIDAEDTLRHLNWPGWRETIQRMQMNLVQAQGAAAALPGGQDAATFGTETGIEPPALPAA